jgi:hypothetical protein
MPSINKKPAGLLLTAVPHTHEKARLAGRALLLQVAIKPPRANTRR